MFRIGRHYFNTGQIIFHYCCAWNMVVKLAGFKTHNFFPAQKIPVRVPIHYDVPRPYEVIKKVPVHIKVPVDKPWVYRFARNQVRFFLLYFFFLSIRYPVPVPRPYEVIHEKPYPVYVEKKVHSLNWCGITDSKSFIE